MFTLLLIILPLYGNTQNFIPTDTFADTPEWVLDITNEEIDQIISVDFSGDGLPDFLVQTKRNEDHQYNEYWIHSNKKLFKIKKRCVMGIQYTRFVNLDGDPECEMYVAMGYEDGVDYSFRY